MRITANIFAFYVVMAIIPGGMAKHAVALSRIHAMSNDHFWLIQPGNENSPPDTIDPYHNQRAPRGPFGVLNDHHIAKDVSGRPIDLSIYDGIPKFSDKNTISKNILSNCSSEITPELSLGSMKFNVNNTREYALSITNTGDQPDRFLFTHEQAMLSDHVILEVQFRNTSGTVISQTPILAPGETFHFVLRLRIPPGTTPKTWNRVYITATSQTCGTTSLATVRTYLFQGNQEPMPFDIEVSKTAFPQPAYLDSVMVFTIMVVNTGSAFPAENVVLYDSLPPGLTYISSDPPGSLINGNVVRWNIGYIEAGLHWSASLSVVPDCHAIATPQPNIVHAISQAEETNKENNRYVLPIAYHPVPGPQFELPWLGTGYCVENITQAVFNPEGSYSGNNDLTNPRPNYFLLQAGNTMLDVYELTDASCADEHDLIVTWVIELSNGEIMEGTGLLSESAPLQFPIGENRIIYTVTNIAGGFTTRDFTLVVLARPEILHETD